MPVVKRKKKTTSNLDVLISEQSALKRKFAIQTFRANGYRKLPYRGSYKDVDGYWILLRKGKVQVIIQWR